jgi:hypothetical protein
MNEPQSISSSPVLVAMAVSRDPIEQFSHEHPDAVGLPLPVSAP